MPTISSFYGILIRIEYRGYSASIDINSLEVCAGHLPRRGLNLALDWAELHRDELRANWTRIEKGEQLIAISPLE